MSILSIAKNGHNANPTGSSLWFIIPAELQKPMALFLERASDELSDSVRELCDEVIDDGDSKYSNLVHIRVGSRRYGVYRQNGVYRVSYGGNCFSMPYNDDEDLILNHLIYQYS